MSWSGHRIVYGGVLVSVWFGWSFATSLAFCLCAIVWYPAVRLISCPPALSFACGALVRDHLALAFISEVAFFRQTLCVVPTQYVCFTVRVTPRVL